MKLPSILVFIISLILGLVVLYVIDPLDKSTACTPFCLALILMALSLRQNVLLVTAVSFVYIFLSASSFPSVYQFYKPPHPYFSLFLRTGIFLVICSMAIYMAYYRSDTQRNLRRIQDILSKLPVPVVVSDAAGYISFMNESMSAIFKQRASALRGKRYVDFFMTEIQEGKAMRHYIELFEAHGEGPREMEMKLSVDLKKVNAQLICLGSGSDRVMLTVLNQVEK